MHILLALIGIASFVAVWYWRLKILSDAAKDGAKLAQKMKNMPRKMAFQKKSRKGGLAVVDDPREAATIIMLEVAQARGAMTEKQHAAIRVEIMHHFDFSEEDAEELINQSGWLSRDAGAAHAIVARMAKFLRASPHLTAKELVDMDGMLVTVSEAEGVPTPDQVDLITVYRSSTGLRV